MPYRRVFDVLWSGRRHIMMMASQVDRFGNQNLSAIGDWARPKAQLIGVRGAPGNSLNHTTSYWVPAHTRRSFVEHVDVVCGVGYDRAAAAGPAATRFHDVRVVVSHLGVFDFAAPDHAMRLRSVHPGVEVDEIVEATGFALGDPRGASAHPPAHARGAPADPGGARPRVPARQGASVLSLPEPHPALRTRLCELAGVRYPIVQTGMGWVAGPRLVAATANAGALGILASATMTLEQLRDAVADVRSRTDAPFGVNLRTDAVDVERARGDRRGGGGEGGELRPGAAPRPRGPPARQRRRGHPHRRRPAPCREGRRVGGRRRHRPGGRGRRPHRRRAHHAAAAPGGRRRGGPGGGDRRRRVLERPWPGGRARLGCGRHRHGDALLAHRGEHGARGREGALPGHVGHRHGGDHAGRRRTAACDPHRRGRPPRRGRTAGGAPAGAAQRARRSGARRALRCAPWSPRVGP